VSYRIICAAFVHSGRASGHAIKGERLKWFFGHMICEYLLDFIVRKMKLLGAWVEAAEEAVGDLRWDTSTAHIDQEFYRRWRQSTVGMFFRNMFSVPIEGLKGILYASWAKVTTP
jgi:hypothetical protein